MGNLKVRGRLLQHGDSCNLLISSIKRASCGFLLQCFNHFSLYLKGREELVVTIYHGLLPATTPPPMARLTTPG